MPQRKKERLEETPEPDIVSKPLLGSVAKWALGIITPVVTAVIIYLLIGTPPPPQLPPKDALLRYDDQYQSFSIMYPSFLGRPEQYQSGDTQAVSFGLQRANPTDIRKEGLYRAIYRQISFWDISSLVVTVTPPLAKDISFNALVRRFGGHPPDFEVLQIRRDSLSYYSEHKKSDLLGSTYMVYLLKKGPRSGRILRALMTVGGSTWEEYKDEIRESFKSMKLVRFASRDSTAK